jgi:hypothetical protein
METGGLLLFSQGAPGCPICHTEIGEQVRAGILNSSFGTMFLLTIAPFPIFAAVITLLYFGKPRTGTKKDEG